LNISNHSLVSNIHNSIVTLIPNVGYLIGIVDSVEKRVKLDSEFRF